MNINNMAKIPTHISHVLNFQMSHYANHEIMIKITVGIIKYCDNADLFGIIKNKCCCLWDGFQLSFYIDVLYSSGQKPQADVPTLVLNHDSMTMIHDG